MSTALVPAKPLSEIEEPVILALPPAPAGQGHAARPELTTAISALQLAARYLRHARGRGRWSALHASEIDGAIRAMELQGEKLVGLAWVAAGTPPADPL